jgi:hypothetical protein
MIDYQNVDDQQFLIKVIDWGLAGRLKEGVLKQDCGTLEY